MKKNAMRFVTTLLVLVGLISLTACGNKANADQLEKIKKEVYPIVNKIFKKKM